MASRCGSAPGRMYLTGTEERQQRQRRLQPSYRDAFYSTTNSQYDGKWCSTGAQGWELKDVPPIQDVLSARPVVRRAQVSPLVVSAKTPVADAIEAERRVRQGEAVLTADVVPKIYPAHAGSFNYPEVAKRGASNPLYQTASQAYGREPPTEQQLPDRYFPSNSSFTKGFMDRKPRNTSLNTDPGYSRIHSAFNELSAKYG
mmetsp:Transcript_101394/g.286022  ORF Transcript_101394/g.286022 Transcript_101394/m.286022 type:complete len:201 (-) Transcript_101394:115-717(-)